MNTEIVELCSRARGFLEADPDPDCRAELESLLRSVEGGDGRALAELEDRFRGPLRFGTAGLRGLIGAGESRMNRAVVLRATHGLVQYVLEKVPDARARGIVIGRDARRLSEQFQIDAAEAALGLGIRVHFLSEVTPTPVLAFSVKRLGASCGVMITASHNPPAYNGYKVYWANGAQIIPPHDQGISRNIDLAPLARDVPRASIEEGRRRGLFADAMHMVDEYLDALESLCFVPEARVGDLSIAYSALHGVGERFFRRAMARRGFSKIYSVAEQAEPDGAFPTVEFPNPEEPRALERVLRVAEENDCDLVLVNDPDADRLGVAVRRKGSSSFVVLDGNEIGVLLARHLLSHDVHTPSERLVMATIVSSQMLKRMAGAAGVRYAETLTGFKWIANEAIALEEKSGLRFVFGYEEALGYTVGTIVRDKDGIGAALVMAELASTLKEKGSTLLDELERMRRAFGFLQSRQTSVTLPGREGSDKIARAMASLRSAPPEALSGVRVSSVWDLEARRRVYKDGRVEPMDRWSGDVVILELQDGGRIAVRPSGTEPKIKFYFEIVETLGAGEPVSAAEVRGKARLDALARALVTSRLGLE